MDYLKLFNEIDKSDQILVVSKQNLKIIIKIKSELELSLGKLFKFKLIASEELVDFLSFSINDEIYLANLAKGIPISITEEIIMFAKYDFFKQNDKLKNFIKDNQKYLIKHPDFLNSAPNFTFNILTNLINLKPLLKHHKLNYKLVELTFTNNCVVKQFNHLEDEIIYTFEAIAKLIESGVKLNDIYLVNVKENYYETINNVADFYQIPIPNLTNDTLYDLPYVKKLLSLEFKEILLMLENTDDLNTMFSVERKIDGYTFDKNINKIITIFNKYPHNYPDALLLNVIINDIKKTKAYQKLNTNTIKIANYDNLLAINSGHVFVVNASYESFPQIEKDNKFLTDSERLIINYPTSEMINESNNNYLKHLINNPNIKSISYSKRDNYREFTASDIMLLLGGNKLETTKLNLEDIKTLYANDLMKSYFSRANQGDKLLTTFDGSFKISEYERLEIQKVLKKRNLKLSPSAITRYYQVPFIYYLERILGITSYEARVSQMIGDFFHHLMEIALLLNFEDKISRSKSFSNVAVINQKINQLIIEINQTNNQDFLYDQFLKIFIEDMMNERDNLLKIKTKFFLIKAKNHLLAAVNFLIDLENIEDSDLLYLEKRVANDSVSGYSDLVKIKKHSFQVIDYKSSKKTAAHFEKLKETMLGLLNDKQTADISHLDLIQVIIYAYLLKLENPNFEIDKVGFFGYFENDFRLNTIFKEQPNEFYVGTKTRQISLLEEKELYKLANALIEKTINNIIDVNFAVKVLKSKDNKVALEEEYFGDYQALAFFYKMLESEDELDD